MVNDDTIVADPTLDRVDYFHVELDSYDVLLAEGAASESFMDDDSRGVPQRRRVRPPLPDDREQGRFCAPRAEAGFAVEAIRRRIAHRSTYAVVDSPQRQSS